MIATVIDAEWRSSIANGKPFVAFRLECDGEIKNLFLTPSAVIGWRALMRQCWFRLDESYDLSAKDFIGKILSVDLKQVHYKDRYFISAFIRVEERDIL